MKELTYKKNNYFLNYITNNTKSDTSIFLIHGYSGSSERWIPFIEKFSTFKIFAVDLPGHNKSSALDKYSIPCNSIKNVAILHSKLIEKD